MRLKSICVAAAVALSLAAAEGPTPPKLETAKFWRLMVQAQRERSAANDAEQAVQREMAELVKACGDKFVPGYQQDANAENAGDLICVPKLVEKEKPSSAPPDGKK